MFRMAKWLEMSRSLDGANTASTRWYTLPVRDPRGVLGAAGGGASRLSAEFLADLRSSPSPRDTAGAAVRSAGRVLF